ncbi:alpha/beta fold hydrolase [Methanofollis sp. UBA420]|jgi:pimeloyl-ACP methyl ester carboxylesterase|uniref:alpha/beta fold hydrolase n=1 Tax=Methanofollis sp. UBA420 TaxID=1915514 RepID=UPI00316AC112
MPTVHVNDIDMYYEAHGEGEPLLMIQGLGFEISAMVTEPGKSRYIDKFTDSYRVIVYDYRGVGRTDKPDMPYTIEMLADDTIGLMDALGIRKAHIMGTSMGSQIAQTIAAKYPERVKGLVLVVGFTRVLPLMRLIGIITTNIPGIKEKMTGWIYQQKYPPTPASFRRITDAANQCDTRELCGRIAAPTLIVNGTKDGIVPMKITRELADGIPGARLVLVEGDHLFVAKNPDLLITPALAFLGEVDGKIDH